MNRSLRAPALFVLVVAVVAVVVFLGRDDSLGTRDSALTLPADDVMAMIDRAVGIEPAPANQSGAAEVRPSSAAADGAGGGVQALPSIQDSDRKIVQTASIRLQVREVGASFEEVGRVATAAGGFVASSNFAFQGEQQVASLTIRVPANRYQDVLREVRALGVRVDNEGSNASDVSEEYTDLSARLRTLEATEAQLLQLLARANTITEILQVNDRLNTVRTEIERVKGRMNLLDRLTEMATITVHLRPAEGVARGGTGVDLGNAVSEAWHNSLEFLGSIAEGVLTVVVFSWWIFILAIPTLLLLQRWLRARPQPPASAA